LHEVEGALQRWKEKVKVLERELDDKLNNHMKIAIATSILLMTIQDHVFQTVDDDTTHENVMAKVNTWVSNRVAMEGVPMDVGQVNEEAGDWWNDEWDVDAVAAWTQCHGCRGYGHVARDCPFRKGKGKGDKGGGKGIYNKGGGKGIYNKGGGKGIYNKGGGKSDYNKGKGKDWFGKGGGKNDYAGKGKGGYQGVCWSCNRVGHKAWECRAGVNEVENNVEATNGLEKPVEEVSVGGGVWVIGAVEVEQQFKRAESRRTCRPRGCIAPPGLAVHNSFAELAGDDGHEDYESYVGDLPGKVGTAKLLGDSGELGNRNSTTPTPKRRTCPSPPFLMPTPGRQTCLSPPGGDDYGEDFEGYMEDLAGKVGTAKLLSESGEHGSDGECLKTSKGQFARGAMQGPCRECECVNSLFCVS
jgi:hypothetical protein